MTERNRFLLKQFAGEASNNGVFGSYEAGTPTVSDDPTAIQSLPAYETGWEDATTSGSKLPRLEEMQGLQKLFCQAIKELYSEGIPLWMAGETYYLNSLCVYFDEDNDFGLYKNITGNNGNNIPPVDTVNWVKLVVDGADKDLSNLSSAGKNIANWSSNVTNCITEIPQDIKLELNNGVLTLKAGSKVYIPNGAGVFNIKSTTTDKTISSTTATNGQYLILCDANNEISIAFTDVSGQTTPSTPTNGMIWFDTTNNIIKRYWGGVWYSNYSLPIASVTVSNETFVNIDQVFNGFGYIGSTIFALPGVKGLIPNGRNEDGSLNSIEVTVNLVKTATFTSTTDSTYLLLKSDGGIREGNAVTYNENKNINNYGYDDTSTDFLIFGHCKIENGKISNFTTKTPFHAVDYNDTEFIGHQAMPSDRGIDLTVLASGSDYTAPANGYFTIDKLGEKLRGAIERNGAEIGIGGGQSSAGYYNQRFNIPVIKGDKLFLLYDSISNTGYFRFIYAEGSK